LTREAGPDAIVVNDVPLLVETGLQASYHLVLVVDAERDRRVRRLVLTRGMSEEQALARIAAQADDERRRAAADVVISNNGDLDSLFGRVDALMLERLRPFEEHLRLRSTAPLGSRLRVSEAHPGWAGAAGRLIGRSRHGLGSGAGGAAVTHVGATAVPGLAAADVIDLMLAVRTLDEADELAPRLADVGFPRRAGEWADRAHGTPGGTWPKRLHGSADPGRPANLHVRVAGSPGWRFALLMRDHLRAVASARESYAAAYQLGDFAYGEAKEPWFDAEARAADDWAEATGWQPPAGDV
jgi:dephospho-CoA kinase